VTQQEHQLMIAMLAQQFQVSTLILEILQAKNVLEGDDLAAFVSLPLAHRVALSHVGEAYRQLAQQWGVENVPEMPPLP
jgi:hypothetical protein